MSRRMSISNRERTYLLVVERRNGSVNPGVMLRCASFETFIWLKKKVTV